MSFGLGTNVSYDFEVYAMDGILGLGRPKDWPGMVKGPLFMEVLAQSKAIKANVFGLHMNRFRDGLYDGEINFGEPNRERYDGDLNYMPLMQNDAGFWEIGLDDAMVDGKKMGFTGRSAIIDSGTTHIAMNVDDATMIHSRISGATAGGYFFSVPCATKQVLRLVFGGQAYDVSPADYVGTHWYTDQYGEHCYSRIFGEQYYSRTQWLVGAAFLKNVYAVFDADQSRLGFGVKRAGNFAETSSSNSGVASKTAASTGED